MARGFLYLVAIIDWASRAVLAWRLSNTMDTSFCIAALDEALARHGKPRMFNTDQGSQFTSQAFTATGLAHDGNDRVIYETDTGWLNYDSNGSAAGGAVHIAQLSPNLALTYADFLVI